MSTDNAQTNYGFSWVRSIYGGPPIQAEYPLKVSQTLVTGEIVCMSYTSGSLREAVEGDTSLFGVMTHTVTTTATEGSTLATVIPFAAGYIWEAKCAAGMAGGPPAVTIGRWLDLEIPTANRHRVDTGAAVDMFVQVGYNPLDKTSTAQGNRVWLMIRNTTTQYMEDQGET